MCSKRGLQEGFSVKFSLIFGKWYSSSTWGVFISTF